MYGNHPGSKIQKSDIARSKKASRGGWRTSDGMVHPVTTRLAVR